MKQLLRSLLSMVVRMVPRSVFNRLVAFAVAAKAEGLAPHEGAKLVLELDGLIYGIAGQQAARYGDGVHVKHRLTGYHQFFIDNIMSDDVVLDVGCGNGTLAEDVSRSTSATVVAVDIIPRNIAEARTRYPDSSVVYHVGDATRDLPEGDYSAVILSNVLEHIEERVVFLKKLVEAADPARLLIRVPIFERSWMVPFKKELGVEWRLDNTHFTEYTLDEFRGEIADAGLEITSMDIRWCEIWAVVQPRGQEA